MEMPPPSHELHCTLPSSTLLLGLGWHLMPRRHRKRSHSSSPSDRCLPPPPRGQHIKFSIPFAIKPSLFISCLSDWALYSVLPTTPAWNWNFAPHPSPSQPFRDGVGLQDILWEGFVLVPRTLFSSSVAWRDVVAVVIFNPSVIAG